MKVTLNVEIRLPQLPNFIRRAGSEEPVFDVAELTDEQLQALGEAWTAALIKHAQSRRQKAALGV